MLYLKKITCSLIVPILLVGCGGTETKPEKIADDSKNIEYGVVLSEEVIVPPSPPVELPDPVVLAPVISETKATAVSDADDVFAELEPNSYIISLKVKSKKHPFYGVGDSKGFVVDGVEGKELILKRGERYYFHIDSTPMHDMYVSTDEMGWGSKIVEEGVEGNFTFQGVVTITPNENTPDVLFYQCQNHKAMGARFFVVDQDDTRSLIELVAEYGAIGMANSVAVEGPKVSDVELKQKLSYASMVVISKPAKRVKNSNNSEAKALFESSQNKLTAARKLQKAGDNRAAMKLIDEALRNMSLASQMVPSEGLKGEQKQRYNSVLEQLYQQEKSYKEAYERLLQEGEDVVGYDQSEVSAYKSSAKAHADAQHYTAAITDIEQADRIVTTVLNEMLDSRTVRYELNLDTPQGEYEYEHNRYLGYAELVPVAIEEKKPSAGQMMLLNNFVDKSKAMNAKGEAMAEDGNYPDAIRLMQEATKQVRKALRMLGVKQ